MVKLRILALLALVAAVMMYIPLAAPVQVHASTYTRVPTSDVPNMPDPIYGFSTSNATYYEAIDETSPNDGDYITGTRNGGGWALFGFTAFSVPPGATINSLKVYYRAKDAVTPAQANVIRAAVLIGEGEDAIYYGGSITDPGANWVTYSFTWNTNPATDSAWTVDDINGTGSNPLTGFGVTSSDFAPDINVSMVYIEVDYSLAPVANFNATPVSGKAPLTVYFTDLSTGSPTSWAWDFNNDGITDNTTQNPSYTYNSVGTYSVNLTASNAGGSDSEVKAGYIVVSTTSISLNPTTGLMNTNNPIAVTGVGFDASESGWVWFDTDKDGVRDTGEPEEEVTTTVDGTFSTTLYSPLLPPNQWYYVRADIPSGSPNEASVIYKTTTTTTALIVTRYDPYGATVNQTSVSWEWMRDNLTVYGDGSTHYYFQGPTFDNTNFNAVWDPTEMVNVDSRDYGAIKGTDVKDLCNLVGGASPGDVIGIKASDNFIKYFDYDDVYNPEPDQGKMLVTWYTTPSAEEAFGGYVSENYTTGMRLNFLAETLNPEGKHVFGLWDQHETLPESRWHYYSEGGGVFWPSSSGLSVKYIYNIEIRQPNLVSCDASGNTNDSFEAGETVYVKGLGLSASTGYKLWIQGEPVSNNRLTIINGQNPTLAPNYVLNLGNDPSGATENITTDGSGNFGPTAIWSIPTSAGNGIYDIIADNQALGTIGTYDTNYDKIDAPGWQGFEVTEFSEIISLTIHDYSNDGIKFGNLDPGQTGPADWGGGVGAITITIGSETNVNVNVQVKGTDFSGTGGTISAGNVKYDSDDNPVGALTLGNSYFTWYTVTVPLTTDNITQVYYWLTIPSGKSAGNYTSTFFYRVVKATS